MIRSVIILFFSTALSAQTTSVHSNLTDVADIKRFNQISSSLVCQCGCGMVLGSCTHTTCMAHSMRHAIDEYIKEGKSNDFIIEGFRKGFGKETVATHLAFARARQDLTGSAYMTKFETGFGEVVLAEPDNNRAEVVLILAALLTSAALFFFVRARLKKLPAKQMATTPSENNDELMKQLYDD